MLKPRGVLKARGVRPPRGTPTIGIHFETPGAMKKNQEPAPPPPPKKLILHKRIARTTDGKRQLIFYTFEEVTSGVIMESLI